jgi:hypothetical protein
MASIGDLFINLGVRADTQTINKVDNGLKNLRRNALLVAGAFTGAIYGLDKFINSTVQSVVALKNLNAQTGLSIDQLRRYQQAGQLSNLALTPESIAQSIANVQRNLDEIELGNGNIAPFQMLGVDAIGQNAYSVIENLRESIKGVDVGKVTNLISQMGLTPDFISILQLSRKEFDALAQNSFLSGRQRNDIEKVGVSMKSVGLRFKALKDQIVAKISPELNQLIQKFFKWLVDNGDQIIKIMSGIGQTFIKFGQAIGNAVSLIGEFMGSVGGMETGVKILAASFSILVLSFSPILAGLTAMILLLDDIAVYRRGGDSLIGALIGSFEKLPVFAKILGGGAAFLALTSLIKSLSGLKKLSGLAAILAPITAFVSALAFLYNAPNFGKSVAEGIDGIIPYDNDTPEDKIKKKERWTNFFETWGKRLSFGNSYMEGKEYTNNRIKQDYAEEEAKRQRALSEQNNKDIMTTRITNNNVSTNINAVPVDKASGVAGDTNQKTLNQIQAGQDRVVK